MYFNFRKKKRVILIRTYSLTSNDLKHDLRWPQLIICATAVHFHLYLSVHSSGETFAVCSLPQLSRFVTLNFPETLCTSNQLVELLPVAIFDDPWRPLSTPQIAFLCKIAYPGRAPSQVEYILLFRMSLFSAALHWNVARGVCSQWAAWSAAFCCSVIRSSDFVDTIIWWDFYFEWPFVTFQDSYTSLRGVDQEGSFGKRKIGERTTWIWIPEILRFIVFLSMLMNIGLYYFIWSVVLDDLTWPWMTYQNFYILLSSRCRPIALTWISATLLSVTQNSERPT